MTTVNKANPEDFVCDDCKVNDGLVFYVGEKKLCLTCARKAKLAEIEERKLTAWVQKVNALAREIDEQAASVHPSVWKGVLAPLVEKYQKACAEDSAL